MRRLILATSKKKYLEGFNFGDSITIIQLAFRSTEKPGHIKDGLAESAWITTAKGLDVQYVGTRGNASARGKRQCERATHVDVTAPTERNITLYLIEKLVKGLFLASAIFSENWPIR